MRLNFLTRLVIFIVSTNCIGKSSDVIRVQSLISERIWERSLSGLAPHLKKYGLEFVTKHPDVIFAYNIKDVDSLVKKPIIILEKHSARLSSGSVKSLADSRVLGVFKNLCLRPKSLYNEPTVMGKYYFKLIKDHAHFDEKASTLSLHASLLDRVYCMPWDIFLSNFSPRLEGLKQGEISLQKPRSIDVFFAGSLGFVGSGEGSNKYYGWHRKKAVEVLESLTNIKKVVATGRPFAYEQYIEKMRDAKIVVSPWGMSEWCYRDAEAMLCGAVLIKPESSFIQVIPDIYQNNSTYVPCKADFSDLPEKISYILAHYDDFQKMRTEARRLLLEGTNLDEHAKVFVNTVRKLLKENGYAKS